MKNSAKKATKKATLPLLEPFKAIVDREEVEVTKIGYWLAKAFEELEADPSSDLGYKYLVDALYDAHALLPLVIKDARERGLIANRVDFGQAFRTLYQAKHGIEHYRASGLSTRGIDLIRASVWQIEEAHKQFAIVLSGDPSGMNAELNANLIREKGFSYGYGYRHVTEEDFKLHGDGGGR